MNAEEQQFNEMVSRQKHLIWHLCSTYRLSDAWQTEDAFQEVLCVLWRDYHTFDHRSSERTWVYRVASNTLLSLKRRRANQPADTSSAVAECVATDGDDQRTHLLQLIDCLDDLDGRIVRAHLYGFSYAEIAHITSLTVAAVAMRMVRAKRKLRQLYEQEERF